MPEAVIASLPRKIRRKIKKAKDTGRGKQWSAAEIDLLLTLIEARKPLGQQDWEELCLDFNGMDNISVTQLT